MGSIFGEVTTSTRMVPTRLRRKIILVLSTKEPDGTTCKDNMAKIKDKQRNPGLDVGFMGPRMDNDYPSLFISLCKTFLSDTSYLLCSFCIIPPHIFLILSMFYDLSGSSPSAS